MVWANGFEQNIHLQQALLGFARIWRTTNPTLVKEIDDYFAQTQEVAFNPEAFGLDADTISPKQDDAIQPLDILVSKILLYAEV